MSRSSLNRTGGYICWSIFSDKQKDLIFSAHRSHAHYLSKGGSPRGLIGELYGKVTGCKKGVGGSMHLVDLKKGVYGCVPIVGSTIPSWGCVGK